MKKYLIAIGVCAAMTAIAQSLDIYQDCDLNVQPATSGVIDGHEWVDLGLPSGTKWATSNIGSESTGGYGEFFAWGETETKSNCSWSAYKYGTSNALTKYCNLSSYGKNKFTDNRVELESSDDVAVIWWGSSWRMPTKAEAEELIEFCTWNDGVVTGPNGKSITFPYAGYCDGGDMWLSGLNGCWTSSLDESNPSKAFRLTRSGSINTSDRYVLRPVRPVLVQ